VSTTSKAVIAISYAKNMPAFGGSVTFNSGIIMISWYALIMLKSSFNDAPIRIVKTPFRKITYFAVS